MAKISISMSDKMEKFVAERVELGDFNNTSEYFRDLVRRDQEKREAEDKLRTIVRRSLKSGIGKRSPEDIWAEGKYAMPESRGGARRYRLTEQAEDDLADVADYTIARFGVEQARKYRDGLFRAFDLLVAFPFLGSDQDHIETGLRRHVHGSHAIYYVLIEDEIVIAALLGPGEDPAQRFAD